MNTLSNEESSGGFESQIKVELKALRADII